MACLDEDAEILQLFKLCHWLNPESCERTISAFFYTEYFLHYGNFNTIFKYSIQMF